MGQWIDLTHKLYDHMPVWPGDRPVEIKDVMTVPENGCSVQRLGMGNHAGTHMDAPAHFLPDGLTVDNIPLRALTGPARLVSIPRTEHQVMAREDLEAVLEGARACQRLILHTGWHSRFSWPAYYQDFPVLTLDAAEYLAGLGLMLLGLDTPSPSPMDDPGQRIHKVLLGAGVVVVESLTNLRALPPGDIDICILPLPLDQASGSPCRAIGRSCGH